MGQTNVESMDDIMRTLSVSLTEILNEHIKELQKAIGMNDPATVEVEAEFDSTQQIVSNTIVLKYKNPVEPYNAIQEVHRTMLDILLRKIVDKHLNKTF